jgi:hypothetical protein
VDSTHATKTNLDFMSQSTKIIDSLEIIIDWWRNTSLSVKTDYTEYFISESSLEFGSGLSSNRIDEITKNFPFKLTKSMRQFYQHWNAELEVASLVFLLPIENALDVYRDLNNGDSAYQIITNNPGDMCLFPIFRGYCKEFYYITCKTEEVADSPTWIQYPRDEPIIYSGSLCELMTTFSECYQNGAFYFDTDGYTEGGEPEEDLEKFEITFQKYNPEYIDIWRILHGH